jgi:hypothetical protein
VSSRRWSLHPGPSMVVNWGGLPRHRRLVPLYFDAKLPLMGRDLLVPAST